MVDAGSDGEGPNRPEPDVVNDDSDSDDSDVADEGSDRDEPDSAAPVPLVASSSSSWSINWINLIPLVLIAVIAISAWRWVEGTDVFSQDDDSDGQLDITTTEPSDVVPTTVPVRTTTTSRPPPSSSVPSTTSPVAPEREVIIRGEMKACRFGSNCLVAGFSIVGWDQHPGQFVCIYPNSRRDFSFGRDDVEEACITADAGDTITIEVDGVRSKTISEQDLDGTTEDP